MVLSTLLDQAIDTCSNCTVTFLTQLYLMSRYLFLFTFLWTRLRKEKALFILVNL